MKYTPETTRYESMQYRRCGNSGLLLPVVSLGLWQNFGGIDNYDNARNMILRAFDLGITQFDLANNYGPPYGSAEETFGRVLKNDLSAYRDELIITSKAGYDMWPGPYGEWGSRKYLVASCDQSLKRLGVEYVDIFYSHRPDPNTPLEETMMALDRIVRSGKALYAGISSYSPDQSQKAIDILASLGTPCLIHQPSYSMLNRWIEVGLLDVLEKNNLGCAVFSPLSQGLLTDRYLDGIPAGSRASKSDSSLRSSDITPSKIKIVSRLNRIAKARGQKLSQLALAWVLKDPRINSVIIGASKIAHIEEAVGIQGHLSFTQEELDNIETILAGK